jgi:hypothetical protein
MPESLESRLAGALAPAQAPRELWARVNAALPPFEPRTGVARWPRLAMAAAIAALMTGGVLYVRAAAHQQESAGNYSPLTTEAIRIHRQHNDGEKPAASSYAIQRQFVDNQPVTILSVAAISAAPPGPKQVRTTTMGALAVSEWNSGGRRWAMVSAQTVHRQACAICHHA